MTETVNPLDSTHAPDPNKVAYQGDATLPPAGYKREEELSRRTDNLAEQMEKQPEQYSINPAAMEVDYEIRGLLEADLLEIPHKEPGYVYKWAQCMYPSHSPGLAIQRLEAMRVKMGDHWYAVWEVVKGDFPEAKSFQSSGLNNSVMNTVRIGDVMLMRCRADVYAALENARKKKDHIRNVATDAGLQQVAYDAEKKGYPTSAGHQTYNHYYPNQANQSLQGSTETVNELIRTGQLPDNNVR